MRHLLLLALALALPLPGHAQTAPTFAPVPPPPAMSLRVATFNVSLHGEQAGELVTRLQGDDAQARRIAAIIQRQRPDVILLNEFDYDQAEAAAELFQRRYLEVGQLGQAPIRYEYRHLAPVNTGVPSDLDLDGDGQTGGEGRLHGNDAWGFGLYPGQYGMLVLSRFPIDREAVRSFQLLRWSTLPEAKAPVQPDTGKPYFPAEVWTELRLSSKSHWDVPIATPLGTVHLLAAHPTPPVFDGPERRNKLRNFDEIRLWAEYLTPGDKPWLCDDRGRCGGLQADARFVIVGDYNADPVDGDGIPGAIRQLLDHPRVLPLPAPRSAGGAAAAQVGASLQHRGAPAEDTSTFGEWSGNLRLDYVLPSRGFAAIASGVFWPLPDEVGADWIDASDHRMVWVDITNE